MRNLTTLGILFIVFFSIVGSIYAGDLEDATEYFLTGQYQKAIVAYEKALATASDKTQIYYNLGVCHEKLGNLERAVSYYKQAGGIKDAQAKVQELDNQIKARKISRLRDEAQKAHDAMNYGTARSKAEEILKLDPGNSWAENFINSLASETTPLSHPESTGIASPETTFATPTDTGPQTDTLKGLQKNTAQRRNIPALFIIIGIVIILGVAAGAFFVGKVSGKETVERALRTLIRLLPAGMLSVRKKDKLTLLFFEEGKIIKAIIEEADGVKIGGRGVAEELVGKSYAYEEKPEGPWSRFAELMIEVYRRAQLETVEQKPAPVPPTPEDQAKTTRKKK